MGPEARPPPKPGPLRRTATVAELQADIDSGATGDKVPAFDPAASPLGTDDEAGGTPTSPEVLAEERRRARREAIDVGTPSEAAVRQAKARRFSPSLILLVLAALACAVVAWAVFA